MDVRTVNLDGMDLELRLLTQVTGPELKVQVTDINTGKNVIVRYSDLWAGLEVSDTFGRARYCSSMRAALKAAVYLLDDWDCRMTAEEAYQEMADYVIV